MWRKIEKFNTEIAQMLSLFWPGKELMQLCTADSSWHFGQTDFSIENLVYLICVDQIQHSNATILVYFRISHSWPFEDFIDNSFYTKRSSGSKPQSAGDVGSLAERCFTRSIRLNHLLALSDDSAKWFITVVEDGLSRIVLQLLQINQITQKIFQNPRDVRHISSSSEIQWICLPFSLTSIDLCYVCFILHFLLRTLEGCLTTDWLKTQR